MAITNSPENRMIGAASHVREVGPHSHGWMRAGTDSNGVTYEECDLCGTRRVRTPAAAVRYVQQGWLNGGEWEGGGYEPVALVGGPVLGQAVRVDTHGADGEPAAEAAPQLPPAPVEQPPERVSRRQRA